MWNLGLLNLKAGLGISWDRLQPVSKGPQGMPGSFPGPAGTVSVTVVGADGTFTRWPQPLPQLSPSSRQAVNVRLTVPLLKLFALLGPFLPPFWHSKLSANVRTSVKLPPFL